MLLWWFPPHQCPFCSAPPWSLLYYSRKGVIWGWSRSDTHSNVALSCCAQVLGIWEYSCHRVDCRQDFWTGLSAIKPSSGSHLPSNSTSRTKHYIYWCTASGVGAAKAPTPLSSPPNIGYPMFPSKSSETCAHMWWCTRHGTLSLFHLGCSYYYYCIPCCTTSCASGYADTGRILFFIVAKIFSLSRIERLGLCLLHWYSAAATRSRIEAFYPSPTLIVYIWYENPLAEGEGLSQYASTLTSNMLISFIVQWNTRYSYECWSSGSARDTHKLSVTSVCRLLSDMHLLSMKILHRCMICIPHVAQRCEFADIDTLTWRHRTNISRDTANLSTSVLVLNTHGCRGQNFPAEPFEAVFFFILSVPSWQPWFLYILFLPSFSMLYLTPLFFFIFSVCSPLSLYSISHTRLNTILYMSAWVSLLSSLPLVIFYTFPFAPLYQPPNYKWQTSYTVF